jgi:hypothetical protein
MTQLDLFGCKPLVASTSQTPDLDMIRTLLSATLQELRGAMTMPWDAGRLKSWDLVFHNMTKWLPSEERDEFIRHFQMEVLRLKQSDLVKSSTR